MTILLWKSAIDDYMEENDNSDESWMSFHRFEVAEDCGDRKRTVKGPFSFFSIRWDCMNNEGCAQTKTIGNDEVDKKLSTPLAEHRISSLTLQGRSTCITLKGLPKLSLLNQVIMSPSPTKPYTIAFVISFIVGQVLVFSGYIITGIALCIIMFIIWFIIWGWKTDLFHPDEFDEFNAGSCKDDSNNND